jgi:DNA polymerase I-like protein with 3'-5' exonuclease and polymerase domains
MKELKVILFQDWSNLSILDTPELALDTETTGLNAYVDDLRLVQIYLPKIAQVAIIDLWFMTEEQEIWFQKLLQVLDNPKVVKYIQNAVFDALWFRAKYNIKIRNIRDTRLMSQILKAGRYDGYVYELGIQNSNSLEYLCEEYGYIHDKQYQKSDWSQLELSDEQFMYAGKDAIVTYKIGDAQYKELVISQKEVLEAEMSCIPAFIELIHQGLPVGDIRKAEFVLEGYQQAAQYLKEKLEKLLPENPCQREKIQEYWKNPILGKKGQPIKIPKPSVFNPNSPDQIRYYIRNKFGEDMLLKFDTKTKEWKESSGKENLYIITEKFPDDYEIRELINFRGINRAASTIKGYIDTLDRNRKCIQTTFSILATQGMGRSSSGSKRDKHLHNTQNFSKHLPSHQSQNLPPVRSIVSARPGYQLLEIDLAASHLQFARILSNDKNLQKAKKEGIKLHYITLAAMLKFEDLTVTPLEAKELVEKPSNKQSHYKHLYKLAKTVIYSFLNYSGGARLQQSFYGYELSVSLEDCKNYLEACAEAYEDLRLFQDGIYAKAQNTLETIYIDNKLTGNQDCLGVFGYSETLDGGLIWHRAQAQENWYGQTKYKLKISDVVSCQWLRPEATVMKNSLGIIDELCQFTWGIDNAHLVNFSHDSLMLEIRKELLPEIAPIAVDVITEEMQYYIPDYEPEETWEQMIVKHNWSGVNW